MSTEILPGTPLADALNVAIQGKIVELGWGNVGDVSALSEYFVLMLANGKSKQEVAAEVSGDLLGLGPGDPNVQPFAEWVFQQVELLRSQEQANGSAAAPSFNMSGAPPSDAAMDESYNEHDGSEMDITSGPAEFNAPTGPKAMRGGPFPRGGREKRMMGHINRAMDRSSDPLRQVRGQTGNERINSHRGGMHGSLPTGPRGRGNGRQQFNSTRIASIEQGLMNMGPMPMGMMGGMGNGMRGPNGMPMPGNGMGGPAPYMMNSQPELLAMMEQQGRMLSQLQQQIMQQQQNNMAPNGSGNTRGRGGKSLFERVSRPQRGGAHLKKPHHQASGSGQDNESTQQAEPANGETETAGEDVDMTATPREPPNPDETVCKYNLRCTNKDCKFAHQSPAAPPGVSVDVKDVCSFGAACKNRKCAARHPSPATRAAHQADMDCKFYPNCTNPHCTFRHPTMPPCRNGGECKVPNCKFTHVTTKCKFHPCTNRFCKFAHDEGQRGTFQDKVWTADGAKDGKDHMSERKFLSEEAAEGAQELVVPDEEAEMAAV